MNRMPVLTPKKLLQALERGGFELIHSRGGHLYLLHPTTKRTTTIAIHSGDIGRGFLKVLLKQAGLTEERFRKLL
jgi:predicted RNA binding protein YcfA (HicA-like mRNA interferase family)